MASRCPTSGRLREDEEFNYDLPQVTDDIGTLHEHGVRALDRGLRFGQHGLPLMGCGDWNDGINLLGQWYRRAYFDDGTPLGGQSRLRSLRSLARPGRNGTGSGGCR